MGMTYEYAGFYLEDCNDDCEECGGRNSIYIDTGTELKILTCSIREKRAEKLALKKMFGI